MSVEIKEIHAKGPQGSGKTILLKALKHTLHNFGIQGVHVDEDKHTMLVELTAEHKQRLLLALRNK